MHQHDLEKKFKDIFGELDKRQISIFYDMILDSNFGKQQGNYSFFCKHCGMSWTFDNKELRSTFEKFHKFTGCSLDRYEVNKKDKANNKSTHCQTIKSTTNVSTFGRVLLEQFREVEVETQADMPSE